MMRKSKAARHRKGSLDSVRKMYVLAGSSWLKQMRCNEQFVKLLDHRLRVVITLCLVIRIICVIRITWNAAGRKVIFSFQPVKCQDVGECRRQGCPAFNINIRVVA